MQTPIVIISAITDAHYQTVAQKLNVLGVPYVLFDQSALPGLTITTDFEKKILQIGSKEYSNIGAVWNRLSFEPNLMFELKGGYLKFAQNEFKEAFKGSLRAFCNHWYNSPESNRNASYKPMQLRVAVSHSEFKIPPTLITSNRSSLLAFRQKYPQIIAKSLGKPILDHDGTFTSVFTQEVDDDFLKQLDNLWYSPCIFQEFITKAYTVKIAAIGKRFFACKTAHNKNSSPISKKHENTNNAAYTCMELPEKIARGCRKMMQYFQLQYATFDFGVTPCGEWYFFEINPNGQWLWMEEMTGMPIASAFADMLVTPAPKTPSNVKKQRP
ncbi:hypothetical protein [Ascidiimonas aurantiaca]|uniref:hypothetical protein n=1 Tax=Ascidiimonas aurantiaca TaxID=1685432 RepID=UPI0030EEBC80